MRNYSKPGDEGRARNISQGVGALALENIIGSALAFVFLAIVVRLTSPVEYAAYSAVLVVVGIGNTATVFGLAYASARFTSSGVNDIEAWGAARAILALALIFGVIGTLIVFALSRFLSLYFMKNADWTNLFLLGALWLLSNSLAHVLQGIVQGMKRYTTLARILIVSRIVMLAFAVTGLVLLRTVTIAIEAQIVYFAVISLWCFKIFGSKLFQFSGPHPYASVLKYSTPLGIGAIFTSFSTYADLVVVGGQDSTSLGVYNLDIQISAVLQLIIVVPLITALLPEISSSSRRSEEISHGLRLCIRFLVLSLLPASLLLAALSHQLVTLFSNNIVYLQGVEPLRIVAISYLLIGVQLALSASLMAIGRTVQSLIVAIASAVVDIFSSLLLVPYFHLYGAAFSKVLVGLVGTGIALYYLREYLHSLDDRSFYLKAMLSSFAPFVLVLALSKFVSSSTLSLIPYAAVGGIAFFLCLKLMRLLTKQDRIFVAQILPLSLRKILRYI